jgi:hypothetical protein
MALGAGQGLLERAAARAARERGCIEQHEVQGVVVLV